MMKRFKKTAIALLLTVTATFSTPPVPVSAFSLTDLLPQQSSGSNSLSGSGTFVDLLLGLLMGKMFSNMTGSSSAPSAPTDLSRILGLTSPAPVAGTPSSATGQALIATGKQFMGVPYVWGGESPAGFDCSGFTQYVMKQNGITIPRTAAEQFSTGTPVEKANLAVGDLVFFTTYKAGASHVGFYMGNDQFLHASSANSQVTISSLSETYYTERYIGARRYIK